MLLTVGSRSKTPVSLIYSDSDANMTGITKDYYFDIVKAF